MRLCTLPASTSGGLTTSQQSKLFPLNLASTVCFKEHKPWQGFIQVPTFQLCTKSIGKWTAVKVSLDVKYYYPVKYEISSSPRLDLWRACDLCIPWALLQLGSKLRCVNKGGGQLSFCNPCKSAPLPSLQPQTIKRKKWLISHILFLWSMNNNNKQCHWRHCLWLQWE